MPLPLRAICHTDDDLEPDGARQAAGLHSKVPGLWDDQKEIQQKNVKQALVSRLCSIGDVVHHENSLISNRLSSHERMSPSKYESGSLVRIARFAQFGRDPRASP